MSQRFPSLYKDGKFCQVSYVQHVPLAVALILLRSDSQAESQRVSGAGIVHVLLRDPWVYNVHNRVYC